LLAGCQFNTPTWESIRDSKLLDRRIKETPREKVIRECRQESDRFRVACTHCHATDKLEEIQGPDHFQLTLSGQRAQIMRKNPAFGASQDCSKCHQSKFHLNRAAEKVFGPGGSRYGETQKELAPAEGTGAKQ
jgi:hypothetical protein